MNVFSKNQNTKLFLYGDDLENPNSLRENLNDLRDSFSTPNITLKIDSNNDIFLETIAVLFSFINYIKELDKSVTIICDEKTESLLMDMGFAVLVDSIERDMNVT